MALSSGGPALTALAPCPRTPNCVSTQATGAQAIEPFTNVGPREAAMRRLLSVLEAMSGTTIVASDSGSIRAEFRTRLLRFTDDATFIYDDATNAIHFRSASRLGRSDFGVNRRRMEEIRTRLHNR